MKHEFYTDTAAPSIFSSHQWSNADFATLSASDITNPWRSVFGFPMNAARLAAGQPLLLHGREDEIFELMVKLNELLANPAVLNQSFQRLDELKSATESKLARLREIEEKPISEEEIEELVAAIEAHINSENSKMAVLDRLEEILKPNQEGDEKVGLQKMLSRLEVSMAALVKVKDQGFHVVVVSRKRQPSRPALEAQRYKPIVHQGQPTDLAAGFLLPASYHLTLWTYVIARSDGGQATVWN
jgi:hypothetical protein